MPDSEKCLSRPEDGVSYEELQSRNFKLQQELELLQAENQSLRQQLADITRHPSFRADVYAQCFRCKDLIAGRMLDHEKHCKA